MRRTSILTIAIAVFMAIGATVPTASYAIESAFICKLNSTSEVVVCVDFSGTGQAPSPCAGHEDKCGDTLDDCGTETVPGKTCAQATGQKVDCATLKTTIKAQDAQCQPTCATGYSENADGKCDAGKKCCVKAAAGGAAPTAKAQFAMPEIDPAEFIGKIIRLLFGISGSLAFAMIIYGGFLWLTSGGAPETMNKAKNVVIWAVLGLAVIFVAYAAVANILGFVFQAVTTSTK